MASIQKRNNKYAVIYSYLDYQGKKRQKWETCDTYAEAKRRKTDIESEQQHGTFVPPSTQTLEEYMKLFIELYGVKNWSLSTYKNNSSVIYNYINPIIGHLKIQEITPLIIEKYYKELGKTKTVSNKHYVSNALISTGTINRIHKLLKCAFSSAVNWGLLSTNVFEKVKPPKHVYKKREIWTSDMIIKALESCEDPKVAIAIHLSFACSLRLGEILGLQWKNVFISEQDIENDNAHINVTCQLEEVSIDALQSLDKKDVLFEFPYTIPKNDRKTLTVLKTPKTQSSIRKIWLPKTLALILQAWKEEQEKYKEFFQDEYYDYDLVVCFEDGRPCHHSIIRNGLNRIIKETDLPEIVFHSLRHSSTTYKLKLNHGDIKATQGDTGHSQADMITEVYSHILDEDRKVNAQRFEKSFYLQSGEGIDHQKEAKKEVDIDALVNALKQDPTLLNQLINALQ